MERTQPCRDAEDSEEDAAVHAISREDQHWHKNIPHAAHILPHIRRLTINVPQDRNRKAQVNPPKNRSFNGIRHDATSATTRSSPSKNFCHPYLAPPYAWF